MIFHDGDDDHMTHGGTDGGDSMPPAGAGSGDGDGNAEGAETQADQPPAA